MKERKKTICPGGTVSCRLELGGHDHEEADESTLSRMPRRGSATGFSLGAGGLTEISRGRDCASRLALACSSFFLAMRAVAKALCSGPTALPVLMTLPEAS